MIGNLDSSRARKKQTTRGKEIVRNDNSRDGVGGPSKSFDDGMSTVGIPCQASVPGSPVTSHAHQHSLGGLIYQQSLPSNLAYQHSLAGSYDESTTNDIQTLADAELLQLTLALQGGAPPN